VKYQLADRIVIRELPSQSEVATSFKATSTLVFSPDGQWLVTGSSGGHRDGDWLAEQGTGGYDRPG